MAQIWVKRNIIEANQRKVFVAFLDIPLATRDTFGHFLPYLNHSFKESVCLCITMKWVLSSGSKDSMVRSLNNCALLITTPKFLFLCFFTVVLFKAMCIYIQNCGFIQSNVYVDIYSKNPKPTGRKRRLKGDIPVKTAASNRRRF